MINREATKAIKKGGSRKEFFVASSPFVTFVPWW